MPWVYGDLDGSGNGYSPAQAGALTVTPDFSDIANGLEGVYYSSVAWGDYDGDCELDAVVTGDAGDARWVSHLYHNQGGTFSEISTGLPGVNHSSVDWGDCDNDGDLDLLLTGYSTEGPITRVYRNDGGNPTAFTRLGASLTGVYEGAGRWGDYDNDGDLDILLTGEFGAGYLTWIYRNNGNNTFTQVETGLPALRLSDAAWGDYDLDGDLDLLLVGSTGSGRISRIYRNNAGSFSDIEAGLVGVGPGAVAWGDYDSDGDLDILMAGQADFYIAKVYSNDGDGTFTDVRADLQGVTNCTASWGDYDNDGDLDILLAGESGVGYISRVYNNDEGLFADIGAGLTGVYICAAAWGDYNSDGRLDILLTGRTDAIPVARIYRNNTPTANTRPTAPGGLSAQVVGDRATFSWNASSDDQMPDARGLSYNLRVGTKPGGGEICSPMAANDSTSLGCRRVVQLGNAQQQTSWTVTLPPVGSCYWSVQAVDGAFLGGPFAAEQDFSLPTGVQETPLPTEYVLRANVPNPFNPATKITFALPQTGRVKLAIFDLTGRLVRVLVDGVRAAGNYEVPWNGTNDRGQQVPSGVYVCRMDAGSFRETRRMTLVK
jgi:hypothetical protein